jgi:hypothetical protein
MKLLFSKIPQFFAPGDTIGPTNLGSPSIGRGNTGVPVVNQATSKEDMIEFMGADDEPADVLDLTDKTTTGTRDKGKDKNQPEKELSQEDEISDETDDEDDVDDLAEIEAELEGPTEEQLELVTPVRRKEILAKFPTLFKEFPYLEKAYYREQQFTELLPTIDDAKMAVEKSATLDRFEADLVSGNTENILKAVKAENIEGFHKIIDDYLPALARVDEQAYYHVIGNLTKHTISAMVMEARKSGNDVLQNAAAILNQFVFGSTDFKPPTNLAKNNPADKQVDDKINERQQAFVKQQYETVNNDLNTKINNTLKNTIDAHLDPKNSMSDYVRRTAGKECLETLESLIARDTRFKSLADKLWEKAFEANFSKESVDRIRSAYLSKAKTLLPSVIKKARNEALRGTGRRVKDDDAQDTTETTSNRGPVAPGRPRSNNAGGKVTSGKDIPKGMSTLDFLNS